MTIKCEVIPTELIEELDFVFDNSIVKECLNEDMWIAGGFARKIGHIMLGIKKASCNNRIFISSYLSDRVYKDGPSNEMMSGRALKYPGDIDFFSNSAAKAQVIENMVSAESHLTPFKSPFATNIKCSTKFNNKQFQTTNLSKFKIQLVTKFCFDSIKENLASIDITNCKYAVVKKHDHYILYYDSKAALNDSTGELHISHSESPYTIPRINRYLNTKHETVVDKLSKEESSVNVFKECLYKVLLNEWNDSFNFVSNYFLKSNLKLLNKRFPLTDFDISMFVGFMTDMIADSTNPRYDDDYGNYYVVNRKVDWASNIINSRASKSISVL